MKQATFLITSLFLTTSLLGSVVTSIPRTTPTDYFRDGLFEGGKPIQANLQGLRLAPHRKGGYERWVFDFSDIKTKTVGKTAPPFQMRYIEGIKQHAKDGSSIMKSPAKFVFLFRNIDRVLLTDQRLGKLAKRSRLVQEIIMYPPIENGDMAVEFILKKNVRFKPHQPLKGEGRLVLDLSSS